jgi:hypothetical protein
MSLGFLGAGDIVVVGASILLFVALIANWFASDHVGSVNAIKYSGLYFVVALIIILISLALIVWPALHDQGALPALPFAVEPVILGIGALLVLLATYEVGRYTAVTMPGAAGVVTAGFGVGLAFVCSWLYLVGALVKWGSRQRAEIR